MPDYSQSYNRYSYAFNNPLRFSDPSGFFAEGDSTLSPSRSLPHLPFLPAKTRLSYRPGASTNTDNTSLKRGVTGSGTALPIPYLSSMLSKDAEGNASEVPSGQGVTPWYSIYNWPALGSSARTMDALYAGDYLSSTGHFLTCAAEVFTLGSSSQITQSVRTAVGNFKVPVYRVYGEGASMYGKSYSLINPEYVPLYRNFAGLPDVNSGQYLLKGSVPLKDIIIGRWFAAPLNGNTGGLPFELYLNYNKLINPVNVLINKPF